MSNTGNGIDYGCPKELHDAIMRYADARGEYFVREPRRLFSHRQKFDRMTDEEVAIEMQAALRDLLDAIVWAPESMST